MRKIKVLWFCNTPANGSEYLGMPSSGSGTWLQALDQLIQNEVELSVAFHSDKKIEFSYQNTDYYGIQKYDNFYSRIFGLFGERFLNNVIDKEKKDEYLSIIKKVQPDIIHIHGTENSFGCIIESVQIPVVISIQGIITVCLHKLDSILEHKYFKLRDFSFKSWKKFIFPTNFENAKKKFNGMSRIERLTMRTCKNFIGRTDWDRRVTEVLSPHRRYFHNDELMRRVFYQYKWRMREQSEYIQIHTTTDNVIYKGFETLCQAINLIETAGYKCNWNIAGISSDDLVVKVVKKKMKSRFPDSSINFLGKVTAEKIVESILSSDCYVMPSHIENSPNSLCEAMLLGAPIISTFCGGVGSIIHDRKEGILIQDGDPWSMAGAIIEIKNNKELAAKLGEEARKNAINRHGECRIAGGLLEIYKTIIYER